MKAERTIDGQISRQSELMSLVLVVSLLIAPLAQPEHKPRQPSRS